MSLWGEGARSGGRREAAGQGGCGPGGAIQAAWPDHIIFEKLGTSGYLCALTRI